METDAPAHAVRFCIVTPVFNGGDYIDQTLASILSQAGAFRLRVHVQDGGSTDGTVARLREWQQRLTGKSFPCLCRAIEFTYAVAPDSGMYDAINKGFAVIRPNDADVMAYLNADDLFLPGALSFVMERMTQFPEVAWVAGRPCEIDAATVMRKIHDVQIYPEVTLRAGLHDGRRMRFVMQESSFWRGWLWKRAGAVMPGLRLAGDYDLWRRFAAFASLYSSEIVLAAHRRRPKQLTESGSGYYDEIDQKVMTAGLLAERDRVWRAYQAWTTGEGGGDIDASGPVIVFNPADTSWSIERREPLVALRPTVYAGQSGKTSGMIGARYLSGFTPEDGPYAHVHLLKGFRYAPPGANTFVLDAPRKEIHTLFLRCRNFTASLQVALWRGETRILERQVPVTNHERDCLISCELMLEKGANTLRLDVTPPTQDTGPGLLILAIEALPVSGSF